LERRSLFHSTETLEIENANDKIRRLEENLEHLNENMEQYILYLESNLSPMDFTQKIKNMENWALELVTQESKVLERAKQLNILDN